MVGGDADRAGAAFSFPLPPLVPIVDGGAEETMMWPRDRSSSNELPRSEILISLQIITFFQTFN